MMMPVVAVGCMRLRHLEKPAAERFVAEALELRANFFDHADIYGAGACEKLRRGGASVPGPPGHGPPAVQMWHSARSL